MFCAVSRALRADHGARSTSSGWSIAHCSTCMPPSEPPIAAEQPLDRRGGRSSAPVHRDEVGAPCSSGKRRPYGSPVAGSRRGRARSCPGSRRGGWRRRRRSGRCRAACPGRSGCPTSRGARGSPWWPAACASPVSAWQTKTALDAVGVELAVGLVGDLDGPELRAGFEHQRVVARRRATTRCVSTRPSERSTLPGTAVTSALRRDR